MTPRIPENSANLLSRYGDTTDRNSHEVSGIGWPIVAVPGRINRLLIDQHRIDHPTHL